jgi:hypothetical protein
MPVQQESRAVAVARAHVEAWSNHDFDAARAGLADDVTVTATTVDPVMPKTDLAGVEDYMRGLVEFAQAVVPGSARVIAGVGTTVTRCFWLPSGPRSGRTRQR